MLKTLVRRVLRRTPVPPVPAAPALLRALFQAHGCGALKTRSEGEAATAAVARLGLPSHHDPQKNWDFLKTLSYLAQIEDRDAAILDAGASSHSVILHWLFLLGYRSLYACDLRASASERYAQRGIQFSVQDLTRTNYPTGHFHAVTCLSVIEHGVPAGPFLAEMSRVLRPGGLLLVSTDYWSEPINCTGIFPYGVEMGEMKVFQPGEIGAFLDLAAAQGFEACAPVDLKTCERAVRWDRVNREYTFVFFALRKRG